MLVEEGHQEVKAEAVISEAGFRRCRTASSHACLH
jgi:hypothetical protein